MARPASEIAKRTLLALALAAAACARHAAPGAAYDPHALPSGPLGVQIAYGRAIVMDTRAELPRDVRARMSCAACHLAGGTAPGGGSFAGTYARFPQWNARAHRVVTLQDRIAECFLYSMNGTPPAYESKAMIAVVAYIAWLSRGTPTLASPPPRAKIAAAVLAKADASAGARIYASTCSACHAANGAGNGPIPPLWGATSFNGGAGMAHLGTMTAFVRANMPASAPGTLSAQEAANVAAFVLAHPRPRFAARRTIVTAVPHPAHYF